MKRWRRRLAWSAWIFLAAIILSGCSVDLPEQKKEGRAFDGTFRLFVTMGEDDPRTIGARDFAQLLEQYSDGTLHCEVYTGNILGSDTDLIKKMKQDTGEVDIFIVTGAYFGEYTKHPELEISAMPYLFTDFDTAWAFADSDLLASFEAELPEENLRVLTHFCGGFRCMTDSKRPIVTPDDLEGLVIRTPAGSLVMDILFELGAKAMPLPFAELKDALAKGYYDGQENPPSIIYYNGLYEDQKYLSLTNHTYMIQNFTIAESIWQQLTVQEQEIVQRAATESAARERLAEERDTEKCIGLLKEKGMEVNEPDLSLFIEATEPFRQKKAQKYKDCYARVKEWAAGRKAETPSDKEKRYETRE